MRVAVSGAHGLVGSAVLPALRDEGHEVARLVRRAPTVPDEVQWDPAEARVVPAIAVRLLLGQMGAEMLLSSTLAVPARLQSAGYEFRYPDLDAALGQALAEG